MVRKRRNMGSGPSRNTVDTPWRHLVYVAANTPPDACLAGYMGIGLRGTCVTLAYQKECLLFFAHLIDTPLLPNPPYRWVFPPYCTPGPMLTSVCSLGNRSKTIATLDRGYGGTANIGLGVRGSVPAVSLLTVSFLIDALRLFLPHRGRLGTP